MPFFRQSVGLSTKHYVLHFRTHHHPAISFRDEPPQRLWDRYVVKCDNTAPMVAFSVCYQGRKRRHCAVPSLRFACVCEPACLAIGNRSAGPHSLSLCPPQNFLTEVNWRPRWRPPPPWGGGCSPLPLSEFSTTLLIASESSWPCRAGSTRRSPRICCGNPIPAPTLSVCT